MKSLERERGRRTHGDYRGETPALQPLSTTYGSEIRLQVGKKTVKNQGKIPHMRRRVIAASWGHDGHQGRRRREIPGRVCTAEWPGRVKEGPERSSYRR